MYQIRLCTYISGHPLRGWHHYHSHFKNEKRRLIQLWESGGQHTAQPGVSLCRWDSRKRHRLPCFWSPAPTEWMKSPPHTSAPQLTKGHLSVTRKATGSHQHWLSSRVFIRWRGVYETRSQAVFQIYLMHPSCSEAICFFILDRCNEILDTKKCFY